MEKEKPKKNIKETSKPTSISIEEISRIMNQYTGHFANQEVEARGAQKALLAVAAEINKSLGKNNDNKEKKKEETPGEPEGLRTVGSGQAPTKK